MLSLGIVPIKKYSAFPVTLTTAGVEREFPPPWGWPGTRPGLICMELKEKMFQVDTAHSLSAVKGVSRGLYAQPKMQTLSSDSTIILNFVLI